MRRFFILALIGLSVSSPARSDQVLQAVRVTCIPEMAIFYVDEVKFNYTWPLYKADEKTGISWEKDRETLRKHGLLLVPGDFKYSCTLPSGTYRIEGTMPSPRPKGACGGAPRIKINFYKDKHHILKDVYFSRYCHDYAAPEPGSYIYVDSISINGLRNTELEYFMFSIRDMEKSQPYLLSHYWKKGETYDQKFLRCLAKNQFVSNAGDLDAIGTCKHIEADTH